jgi:DNA-binding NtrC family response regulator
VDKSKVNSEAKRNKILIVDDDANIAELFKRILERHDYAVLTSSNGKEALELLKANPDINIAFTDITMPKLDGFGFLKQSRDYNPKIEVIIMTGHSDVERSIEAVKSGAFGYLIKPLQIADIMGHLRRAEMRILEKEEMLKKARADQRKSGA